jgi:ABC-type uncharacterized transport system YnjBCD ATPase subunit
MTSNLNHPPETATWGGAATIAELNQALARGQLALRRESFSDLDSAEWQTRPKIVQRTAAKCFLFAPFSAGSR